MPFKSEKQRRFLWKFHPDVAKHWSSKYGTKVMKKKNKVVKKAKKKSYNFAKAEKKLGVTY